MRKLMFAAGMAIGYVLGSKAGRERYEQICSMARRIRDNTTVHNTATTLKEQAEHMATASKDKIMNSDLGNKLFRDDDLKKSMDPEPEYWEKAGIGTSSRPGGTSPTL